MRRLACIDQPHAFGLGGLPEGAELARADAPGRDLFDHVRQNHGTGGQVFIVVARHIERHFVVVHIAADDVFHHYVQPVRTWRKRDGLYESMRRSPP